MAQLILIRGVSGSGKTTLAKKFVDAGFVHIETDMFFEGSAGYVFDPSRLSEAHTWTLDRTRGLLAAGFDVVVANTFTRKWEMARYLEIKTDETTVIVAQGKFQNVHGVTPEKVQQMHDRFEW